MCLIFIVLTFGKLSQFEWFYHQPDWLRCAQNPACEFNLYKESIMHLWSILGLGLLIIVMITLVNYVFLRSFVGPLYWVLFRQREIVLRTARGMVARLQKRGLSNMWGFPLYSLTHSELVSRALCALIANLPLYLRLYFPCRTESNGWGDTMFSWLTTDVSWWFFSACNSPKNR